MNCLDVIFLNVRKEDFFPVLFVIILKALMFSHSNATTPWDMNIISQNNVFIEETEGV